MAKTTRLCDVEGCGRKHRAKGMCTLHYTRENPPPRKFSAECPTCGAVTMKRDKNRSRCSPECNRSPRPRPATVSKLPVDHPVRVLIRRNSTQIGPLREAYESADWITVLALVEAQCVKVDGCWLWPRRASKGYGKLTIGGRNLMLHRLTAQATRHGDLDARMPVHHTCAETLCCNPLHLQVVTPQENVAEMLERRYYKTRIAQLEAALIAADPTHPLIRIAQAV